MRSFRPVKLLPMKRILCGVMRLVLGPSFGVADQDECDQYFGRANGFSLAPAAKVGVVSGGWAGRCRESDAVGQARHLRRRLVWLAEGVVESHESLGGFGRRSLAGAG